MRWIDFQSGAAVPALGQGTWNMGETVARKQDEVRALQLGLDLGMTLIDTAEMYGEGGAEEVVGAAIAGRRDQVLYNLMKRGFEFDLLPWARAQGMPIMAYSPLETSGREQAALLDNPGLRAAADAHGVTPAQIALAWVLHQDGVIAIPKAVDPVHLRANRAAADLRLSAEDLAALDKAFPPPRRRRALDMR